ncbi:zinc finger protein 318-like [Pseudophryne corroboree]|uniref:zinc finger protein 318-like n=1 Tax=Pseudophryne corroboree TaxID=495146 RepID=UPI003081A98C
MANAAIMTSITCAARLQLRPFVVAASDSVYAMYRSSMRRDTPPPYSRDRSRKRSRSCSRRRSPTSPRRYSARRSRSRSHDRSRSRSYDRSHHRHAALHHRSPTSPRRSLSPRHHPTTSRRSPHSREHSPAASRSRSSRASSSRDSHRNRSPPKSTLYKGTSREQRHYSPSYRYSAARDHRSPDHPLANPSANRYASDHDSISSSSDCHPIPEWPCSSTGLQDRRPDEPLPMPKKSILKKRTELEAMHNDQSPRVDISSNKDLKDLKSSPAPVRSSDVGSNSSKGPDQTILPQTTTSHNPTKPFVKCKEDVKTPDNNVDNFLLPHKQAKDIECKLSTFPAKVNISGKTLDQNQRSTSEIEDEERFLYGDEDNKNEASEKVLSSQTQSVPAPVADPNQQEFDKIHDLLKTIGLDIGVAEIGNLATRTQERLHGKKLVPKFPQAPKEQTPPVLQRTVKESIPKEQAIPSPKVEIPTQPPTIIPVPEPISSASEIPMYPTYSYTPVVPSFSMPPPSHNPYSPYPTYPASSWPVYPPVHKPAPKASHKIYTHRNLRVIETSEELIKDDVRPSIAVDAPTASLKIYTSGNLRVIETTEEEDVGPFAVDGPMDSLKFYTPRYLRVIETTEEVIKNDDDRPSVATVDELLPKQEANCRSETEKIIVTGELNKKEHTAKTENLQTLNTKTEQLSNHQGLLLQEKPTENGGQKDPILEELNSFLSSDQKQISSLNPELDETKEKKQNLIKGSDGESEAGSDSEAKTKSSSDPVSLRDKHMSDPLNQGNIKSGEVPSSASSSNLPSSTVNSEEDIKHRCTPPKSSPHLIDKSEPNSSCFSKTDSLISQNKLKPKSTRSRAPSSKSSSEQKEPTLNSELFEYCDYCDYCDYGGYWCEDCCTTFMSPPEFLLHLHDEKHTLNLKEQKKPWAKKKANTTVRKQNVNVPLRGPEYMLPIRGYYCELCKELFPDYVAALEHLKTHAHNEKYKKRVNRNCNYELKRHKSKKQELLAAQVEFCKPMDRKRKATSHEYEPPKQNKSKKAKREEHKEKIVVKRRSSLPTAKSDKKENTTPAKKPVESSTVGKFVWKIPENKSQIVSSTLTVESAAKNDYSKGLSVKEKGIEIKLLGKPNNTQGSPLYSTSSSSSIESSTSTVSTSTTSSSTTTTTTSTTSSSTTQTRVRPNLPGPTILKKTPSVVPVSKPVPLSTFLSKKSSSTSSKSFPILEPAVVLSDDLGSEAFGGQLVNLKETEESLLKPEPVSTVKTTKVTSSDVKVAQENTISKAVTGSVKVQHMQSTMSSSQSPSHVAHAQTSQPQINTTPAKIESHKAVIVPSNSTNSTSQAEKGEDCKASNTPLASMPGNNHSQEKEIKIILQKPAETKAPSKPEQIATQFTSLSMNPVTLYEQKINKETTALKPSENKPVATTAPSVNPTSVPAVKPNPTYNATAKLNQKFKRAPLSLPFSFFGHVPDLEYKDIKISFARAQNSSTQPENSAAGQQTIEQEKVTTNLSAKMSPAKDLQHELDSYYMQIATEDNPEDLTTSEDQEMEAPPVVISVPVQVNMENPPKNIKLEKAQPHTTPVKPVIPVESCEDLDDSDMACEVPDVPLNAITNSMHKTFGQNVESSSYASSQVCGTAAKQPTHFSN